jgi:hypothetical protein
MRPCRRVPANAKIIFLRHRIKCITWNENEHLKNWGQKRSLSVSDYTSDTSSSLPWFTCFCRKSSHNIREQALNFVLVVLGLNSEPWTLPLEPCSSTFLLFSYFQLGSLVMPGARPWASYLCLPRSWDDADTTMLGKFVEMGSCWLFARAGLQPVQYLLSSRDYRHESLHSIKL